MKLSLFKISILLIIIGALGTIIVFSESEKLEQFMTLKQTESDEISLYFEAGDIGYHKVTIPEFDGQGFFYRIVDDNYDIISKGLIQTKMSISIPTGVMFVGGLLLLFTSYIKLKNYRIEQPDENIK